MTNIAKIIAALTLAISALPAFAQETVVHAANVDALFVSADPVLHRNKQAAYHIMKDLLEAGRWELADRWMTERYIQHNPFIASGRQTIIDFFTKVVKEFAGPALRGL